MLKRYLLHGLLGGGMILSTLGAIVPASSANVFYQLDSIGTGTTPDDLLPTGLVATNPNYTGSIVGDLMWLNSYQVQAGGEVLTSISLTWGAAGAWAGQTGLNDWQSRPYPVSVFLYSDPNNDGNPEDAQWLTQAETTVQNPDSLTLTTVQIRPTRLTIGTQFFVGALFRNQRRGQLPATIDTTNPTPGRSWFVIANHGDNTPSNFNALDLRQNYVPPTPLDGRVGNWVLRVTGEAAPADPQEIPEGNPSPGLLGLGCLGLLDRLRRSQQPSHRPRSRNI